VRGDRLRDLPAYKRQQRFSFRSLDVLDCQQLVPPRVTNPNQSRFPQRDDPHLALIMQRVGRVLQQSRQRRPVAEP